VNLPPSWLARECKIFIDTSSFLVPSAREALLSRLLPKLAAVQATALVSVRTVDFLQDRKSHGDGDIKQGAQAALDILNGLLSTDRVVTANDPHPIGGDKHDTTALYGGLFIGFQHEKELCLITENEALALQVIRNARLGALLKDGKITVKGVYAAYIEDGQFKNWVPRLMNATSAAAPLLSKVSIEQQIAAGFKVIADTSSLILLDVRSDAMLGPPFFIEQLLPLFRSSQNRLIVPERVIRELEKHVTSTREKLREQGPAGLAVLKKFDDAYLLEHCEDEHEVLGTGNNFADPVFLKLAIRFQQTDRLCFITQDTLLAKALIENRSPGNEQRFLVTFITMQGRLGHWEKKLADQKLRAGGEAMPRSSSHSMPDRSRPPGVVRSQPDARVPQDANGATSQASPRDEHARTGAKQGPQSTSATLPFALTSQIDRTENKLIVLSQVPATGTRVFGKQSGAITLGEQIASGGEGTIYKVDQENVVCKIYHKDCLTTSRRAKLELMQSRAVRIHGVCWPTELVTTSTGDFVGYLMPMAHGKILKTSVFVKPLLLRTFPHWTRVQLTQLAITILRTINHLHQLNIFIGDINPLNILVVDERNISIVDVDSFQIEGFPCPVGTETFTPAERQGQNYAEFLRSRDDELFAVTTLLFMILFPGKAPYSSQGGGEAIENIRNKRFAYGRDADGRPPVGSWQFIWSHLHPGLKDVFTTVFANGERVQIEQMVTWLQRSLTEVKDGRRSDELFPDKPRLREGSTVRTRCDSCPPDKAEHDISASFAESLRQEGRQFRCSPCAALRKINRLESTRDADCALHVSPLCFGRTAVPITHLDSLKASNRAYWCKPCGEAQRQARAGHRPQGHQGGSQGAGASKAKCFVATASYCSESAPEVLFLRHYRDQILQQTPAGRCFIAVYYRVGPWLAACVEAIPRLRPVSRRALDSLIARIDKSHPHLQGQLKQEQWKESIDE
jgi:rRNA-processing protein FCF1